MPHPARLFYHLVVPCIVNAVYLLWTKVSKKRRTETEEVGWTNRKLKVEDL